ncbi:glucoamylase I precursor [Polychytrium aggregatum]|uniref:glucoamylase I precursor n=1 Tax=Polychytrium aggregatum TaxID=110093 RepID=UPI0022FDE79C|nr:glucoamylase I precursor [Polychytrium aggregatum]KAI9209054.1 glucoamylase I precursor [Polychytrium aggregatum]
MPTRMPIRLTRPIALRWLLLLLVGLVGPALASLFPIPGPELDATLAPWIKQQYNISHDRLLQNIFNNGSVIASPSRSHPDYFYTWIRDSALVMDVVVSLYRQAKPGSPEEARYESLIWSFVHFSKRLQEVPNRSGGLGEPKFHVDGRPFAGDWGRPQNDGPALRALVFIRFAVAYLDKDHSPDKIREFIYDSNYPSSSPLKRDLEYVAQSWPHHGFELWEEVDGHHFHTKAVQRAALEYGWRFARLMNDEGAAKWYYHHARSVEVSLREHWSPFRQQLIETLDWRGDNKGKAGLDLAVILASIQGQIEGDEYMYPCSGEVLITALEMMHAMQRLYPINAVRRDLTGGLMGPAIGRYIEDVYDGDSMTGGNPWVLGTCGYAELLYYCSAKWASKSHIKVTEPLIPVLEEILGMPSGSFPVASGGLLRHRQYPELFTSIVGNLSAAGDAFLRRVRFHTPTDGSMSEQIDRHHGAMRGARHLSWSYASFMTATWRRAEVVKQMERLRMVSHHEAVQVGPVADDDIDADRAVLALVSQF